MFYLYRLSIVLFVSFVVLCANGLSADTINVPAEFATIQAAINAATGPSLFNPSGDQVVVAPGTYIETINFNGKAITVRSSSNDPTDTIIDGDGSGTVVTCTNGETAATLLQGFTLTGGYSEDSGGGMYNKGSNPTVTNCTFTGNWSQYGGGMFNASSSSPTVTNCEFSGNTATVTEEITSTYGGGMYNYQSNPTVTNCTFSDNRTGSDFGGYGGGMSNKESSPTVTNCEFSDNSAEWGGGMSNRDSSDPTITNCTFSENSGWGAGGMQNYYSSPTITNCLFDGNEAETGGGMYNTQSDPTMTNCTFSENYTLFDGAGMHNSSSNPTITNCILWGNSAVEGNEIYNSATSTPTVTYSCIQGGYTGTGNIDSDPLFVDADGPDDDPETWQDNNLRLSAGSPCLDVGNNWAIPVGVLTDLDGNTRIANVVVDMGAYELQPSCDELCPFAENGDINCDGIVNILDLAILAANWLESSE